MIFLYISAGLLALILLIMIKKIIELHSGNKKIELLIKNLPDVKLSPMDSVNSLKILPLVDFYTDNDNLETEPGVSYLIRADDTTILLDTVLNRKKKHPSPLLHNMNELGIDVNDLDMIFFSHLHLDHLGGMEEQKNNTFSISHGSVTLPEIPVYSPGELTPSEYNPGPSVTVINGPVKLSKGIASLGTIPRNLFLMGPVWEQSIVINVKGKGLVIIIGCGHPTVERIVERAKAVFDEPIYGIIGGLHFPIPQGRIKIGPLNIQAIVGSDRVPWKGIIEDDVDSAIKAIKEIDPRFISLSPHDSSDQVIQRFKDEFGERYYDLKVGSELAV